MYWFTSLEREFFWEILPVCASVFRPCLWAGMEPHRHCRQCPQCPGGTSDHNSRIPAERRTNYVRDSADVNVLKVYFSRNLRLYFGVVIENIFRIFLPHFIPFVKSMFISLKYPLNKTRTKEKRLERKKNKMKRKKRKWNNEREWKTETIRTKKRKEEK